MSPARRLFRYAGLEVDADRLTGRYELDGRAFAEASTFEGVAELRETGGGALAQLWYLVAGLSYYKAAQRGVSTSATPRGGRGVASSRRRWSMVWASSRTATNWPSTT